MRRSKIKGYRVTYKGDKAVVEPIPYFKMNVSQRLASKKRVRVGKRTAG